MMDERTKTFLAVICDYMYAFLKHKDTVPPVQLADRMTKKLQQGWGDKFSSIRIYTNWVKGTVIGMDLDIIVGNLTLPVRFITQNPNKRSRENPNYLSEYAKLVAQGYKIVWVMKRTGEGSRAQCEFLGRIQDGEYISNKQRAERAVGTV